MRNIIGKKVHIGTNAKIGYGVVIEDGVSIGEGVRIGNHVTIEAGCQLSDNVGIGHHSLIKRRTRIGDHTRIDCLVSIAGKVLIGRKVQIYQLSNIANGTTIEDHVFIGPGVIFANTRRISHGRSYPAKKRAPVIRWGSRIGSGSRILPEVEIGEECMIGMGSVVTKSTKPRWVYYGNPARAIKPVPEEELLK